MTDHMDVPPPVGAPDWHNLYLYRRGEMEAGRPLFTGDVYFDVEVHGVLNVGRKNVLILQHPCALRTDGIHLVESIMVAEVVPDRLYSDRDWQGNYKIMPLPFLDPETDQEHYSAKFLQLHLSSPDSLERSKRVASMTLLGVNLLLQRWVYHNSRGLLPTAKYKEATSGPYEEADAIEEWCSIRCSKGLSIEAATEEANNWLDNQTDIGIRRRVHFENEELRAKLRRKMRQTANSL